MDVSAQFVAGISEDFCSGRARYGEIDLTLDSFVCYVSTIVRKCLKECATEIETLEFAKRLYLRDLYIACGCVQKSERAWRAFDLHYRKFITDLVYFNYRYGTDNEEVADSVLVSLYLPDRSGRQRIASYDGRSSLTTWLRVIVVNRSINDRNERKLPTEEPRSDIPDGHALVDLELAVRAKKYGKILTDCLSAVLEELTPKERIMLVWRYDDDLPLGEIARLLGIHQSNVTRQLERLQLRIREHLARELAVTHKLSASAIQECLADALENPRISVSLMDLIKHPTQPVSSLNTPARKTACR